MQDMATIRAWHFSSLENTLAAFTYLLETTPQEALTQYRDGGNGWTALEVLCHLRDFEEIFRTRADLTINEDFPALPFPDPDELAITRRYNEQNPEEVLATWKQIRTELHQLLKSISDEQTWERPGNHPKRGRFTLNDQFLLTVWHDTNHLQQMFKILKEQ
jgi:uncharacterized damage-inducible protein DinB